MCNSQSQSNPPQLSGLTQLMGNHQLKENTINMGPLFAELQYDT